ncbi:MAG: integrase core domain-containing protein [Phycisphaerae bacterium]
MAPIANCYIECWIGSLKRECLNLFYCFGLDQLDKITSAYVSYHNTVRPHQGLGNVPIPERDKELKFQDNTEPIGKIGCRQWLGGLIKSYHREAA